MAVENRARKNLGDHLRHIKTLRKSQMEKITLAGCPFGLGNELGQSLSMIRLGSADGVGLGSADGVGVKG